MLSVFFLLICAVSTPQPVTAVRVENGPSIDGKLDDSVWESAETVTSVFRQFGPVYGEDMTEPTEIRVLYDDTKIYFGFFLQDPDHESMMGALTPRDNYITGEWIAILLDTWNDGREASSFEVSLANSQMDSKINPHGGWDYSWDAVWESGTSKVPGGWCAEFAIPFSCLRFDSESEEQVWAVNFQRILSRTSENGWYVLSESGPMADLENFMELRGISGISGSLGAEVRPYGSGNSYHHEQDDTWDHNYQAGMDVKVGIGSGIAADFTLNPDFGQVEADAAEMNLSHFELFLQEKRPFFLESQSLFSMPFNMFYSRRIGAVAPNGDVIPIIGGAKISGSLGGGFRIGFLDAVTAQVSEDDMLLEPASNFGILRTVREFGTYSYIGFSAVSKETWQQDDFEEEHNNAAALDCGFELPGNHLVELAAARSWNTGIDDDGAYRVSLSKIRSLTGYSAGYRYMGEEFSVNGTGYTTMTGYWETWGEFWKNIRPERTFSEMGFGISGNYSELRSGEITNQSLGGGAHATLQNGVNFGVETSYTGETFDPYEGPEGRTYGDHADFYTWIGTNSFDPLYVRGSYGGGQWESGGTFQNYSATVRFRPSSALDVRLSGDMFLSRDGTNWNWQTNDWDTRDTDWKSLILRMNYIFTPDVNLRLFSQYSLFRMDYASSPESESSEITANVLFSWQYLPGSMFYFLVENLFQEDENGDFGAPNLGLYAKVTWYLPI